jgi:hypothetical protein
MIDFSRTYEHLYMQLHLHASFLLACCTFCYSLYYANRDLALEFLYAFLFSLITVFKYPRAILCMHE